MERIAPLLRCPVCAGAMASDARALRCARGHAFDIARQGYANLRVGRSRGKGGDTAEMVAARDRFTAAGYYAPLAAGLARAAAGAVARANAATGARGGEGAAILDVGAGTGYYLARALEVAERASGVALDASKAAARRAARAHPRAGAIVADAAQLPLRSGVAAAAITAFAPRHPREMWRVLAPGGRWLIAAPAPDHLAEVARPLGLLAIEAEKEARLVAAAAPSFALCGVDRLRWTIALGRAAAADLASMGPNAFHDDAESLARRAEAIGEDGARATAAISLYHFAPRAAGG